MRKVPTAGGITAGSYLSDAPVLVLVPVLVLDPVKT